MTRDKESVEVTSLITSALKAATSNKIMMSCEGEEVARTREVQAMRDKCATSGESGERGKRREKEGGVVLPATDPYGVVERCPVSKLKAASKLYRKP